MVLVGPSGCDKTTALRMVAGREDITEGSLRIGNRAVNEVSPKARDIAMVFQNYAFHPHDSGREHRLRLEAQKGAKAEIKKKSTMTG